MSITGSINDELSQPITESFLHLSSDTLSNGTLESLEEMTQSISHEMTRLIQLAKDLDREQGEDVEDLTEVNNGESSNGAHVNFNGFVEDDRGSDGGRSDMNNSEPSFSSHSTPIVNRRLAKKGTGNQRRSKLMQSIKEIEDETISSKTQSRQDYNAKGSTKSPYTLEEICKSLKPFLSKELSQMKELKDSIEALMKQQNSVPAGQNSVPVGQDYLYRTPNRNTARSDNNDSNSGDEDDRLSLSGVTHEQEIKVDYHDKESLNNDDDSPVTTPPMSSETKDTADIRTEDTYTDRADPGASYDFSYIPKNLSEKRQSDKKIYVQHSVDQDDETKQLREEVDKLRKEANFFKQENLNLKIHVNDLEIKMSEQKHKQDAMDLTSDTIDFNDLKEEDPSVNRMNDQIKQLRIKNAELTSKLQRSQQNNRELVNELNYYKGQHAIHESAKEKAGEQPKEAVPSSVKYKVADINHKSISDTLESNKTEIYNLKKKITDLQAEVGDKALLISKDSVAKDFRAHYTKLGLHKIDSMSKVELANLMKNVMLSLLISDIDNLPDSSVNLGKYLKLSLRFLDTLHATLYQNSGPVKPSFYIRAAQIQDKALDDLQSCLDGIIDHIRLSCLAS